MINLMTDLERFFSLNEEAERNREIKLKTDGYTVTVKSVEEAIKAREPVINELFEIVKKGIEKTKERSSVMTLNEELNAILERQRYYRERLGSKPTELPKEFIHRLSSHSNSGSPLDSKQVEILEALYRAAQDEAKRNGWDK